MTAMLPPWARFPGVKTQLGVANQAQVIDGLVLSIDGNIALVQLRGGRQERVRCDVLPGRSSPPREGEKWLLDRRYGSGWVFASPMGEQAATTSGGTGYSNPDMAHGWLSYGAPYLPAGYLKDSEGWVSLCGRIDLGAAGQSAFQLPVGYRPGGTVSFVVPTLSGMAVAEVDVGGNVTPMTDMSVSLDPIRFLAQG